MFTKRHAQIIPCSIICNSIKPYTTQMSIIGRKGTREFYMAKKVE